MAAVEALERVGCDAAGYRLSGDGVDRLCVVHLWGEWRLLLAFPEPDVAVIIDIGEHLAHDPGRDIYQRLYEAVAMDPPDAVREKPPCCNEAGPPADAAQVDRLRDAFKELVKPRRRR
ncbi:MAG: hypothetical protein QOE80_3202 [Actinomycetota bacterium]|nr:hypothetical protein [Actinomycetota bacterium]